MDPVATMSGRCLCGAVSFTATGVNPALEVCHCSMCRRWAGGPFMAIGVESVDFEGADAITRFDSSEWAARGSCGRCGSALFYYFKPMGHYMMLAGTFDDQSPFRLTREIFIDHKPASYDFAGDVPRLTEAETIAAFQAQMDESSA